MKKVMSLVMALILSLSLVACAGGGKDSKETTKKDKEEVTSTKEDKNKDADKDAAKDDKKDSEKDDKKDEKKDEKKDDAKDAKNDKDADKSAEKDDKKADDKSDDKKGEKDSDAKAAADDKTDDKADEKDDEKNDDKSSGDDKLAEIKERGVIYMGTSPDFPPNEFYILDENNKKQIVGSDVALAQAIADEIGVKLEIKATDFDSVLANIQAGQVDMGIAGFAATEKRKETMQFSIGYQREASDGYQGILTTKKIADEYKDLDSFKDSDLIAGAQAASIQFEMAEKLTGDTSKIKQLGTMDALALALNAGDIDYVVVSTSSVEPLLDTFTDFVILPQDGFDLDPDEQYSTNVIGFPLGEEYESLIELANEVIKTSRENGDLESWVDEAKALRDQQVE